MRPFARPSGMIWAPPRFAVSMGQAPAIFRVVVTDDYGRAISGVRVEVSPSGAPDAGGQVTDADGIASFSTTAPEATVTLRIGELVTRRRARTDETLFVQLPICAPEPFLTKTEIAALIFGTAVAGAGFHWKIEPLQIVGEVVFGAAAFTAIYRHSCNW